MYFGVHCTPPDGLHSLQIGFHLVVYTQGPDAPTAWNHTDPRVLANAIVKLCPDSTTGLDDAWAWLGRQRVSMPPQIAHFTLDMQCLQRPAPDAVMARLSQLTQWYPGISLLVPSHDPRWFQWWRSMAGAARLSLAWSNPLPQWRLESPDLVFLADTAAGKSAVTCFPESAIILPDTSSFKVFKHFQKQSFQQYRDILIDPLQPLRDNLSLGVYEQFEKDDNKYTQYDRAIELALGDLSSELETVRVLVVGPGKGKIVDKLFKNNIPMTVTLVEKNPDCMHILSEKNQTAWKSRAEIVYGDIRSLSDQLKPHLVISELLGSFGDNELCPEILARFNQAPTPRIMIPASYSSYLKPVFAPLLTGKELRPYLSSVTKSVDLDEPQLVWDFEHPSSYDISCSKTLKFISVISHNLNCFMGYFKSNLYGHINISIMPDDAGRPDFCNSWFPILFPVQSTFVDEGQELLVEFSRVTTSRKVWYVWKFQGTVYNESGSYCMDL